jgi:hypothetical protein
MKDANLLLRRCLLYRQDPYTHQLISKTYHHSPLRLGKINTFPSATNSTISVPTESAPHQVIRLCSGK